jgi:hypothetical protein
MVFGRLRAAGTNRPTLDAEDLFDPEVFRPLSQTTDSNPSTIGKREIDEKALTRQIGIAH